MTGLQTEGGHVTSEVEARLAGLAVVPVIEIPDAKFAAPLAETLIAAGLPCAEVTFRTPAAADAIAVMAGYDMLVGAGTVLSAGQADVALDRGARFLVSPGFSEPVVRHARDRGAVMIPGVCTPTELEMARGAGIGLVKFFPAGPAGGIPFLKALGGPYRDARFIPTGGIGLADLAGYLALPQVVAVGGSWMVPPAKIAEGEFADIAARVAEAVAVAARVRPRVEGR
jgi:2-dehydro-3-deoxyphosphogluconate aldolase / (4S)-4-hydroxy-2-oxoglutarate aldolase